MNKPLKITIQEELDYIAMKILQRGKRDANGLYWETTETDFSDNAEVKWIIDESIYSGTGGVTFFLLELYTHTRIQEYKIAAVESAKWLAHYCKNNSTDNYCFYTGRLGIAFLFLKMYQRLGEKYFLKEALEIGKLSVNFLKTNPRAELLSGASGSLLVLIHIHAATGNKQILKSINTYVSYILGKIKISKQGICWDQDISQINSLCGFSHGASGIGFTFLELGRYFNNKSFLWIAQQAFLYERAYYSAKHHNWADLRKMNFNEQSDSIFREAYRTKNWRFFSESYNLNAWCHGAVGIGLSRLRAYELTKLEIFKREVQNSIYKTKQTDVFSEKYTLGHTLCHGLAGNAFLFTELYSSFEKKTYFRLAEKLAQRLINEKSEKGYYVFKPKIGAEHSPELFTGLSGVGYFYLCLLSGSIRDNILLPKLSAKHKFSAKHLNHYYLNINTQNLREIVLQKTFPRTLIFLRKFKPSFLKKYFLIVRNDGSKIESKLFSIYLNSSLNNFEPEIGKQLKDLFRLENEVNTIKNTNTNLALTFFKARLLREKSETEVSQNLKLSISPDVKIITSKYNWHEIRSIRDLSKIRRGSYHKILRKTIDGVEEVELSPFNYLILFSVKNGNNNISKVSAFLNDKISLDNVSLLKHIRNQVAQNEANGIIEYKT